METAVQFLAILVNPWTLCLLVLCLVFRHEVVSVLRSFGSFTDSVTELKYKDLEISASARIDLARQLVERAGSVPPGEPSGQPEAETRQLSCAVEQTLSSVELSFLADTFAKADTLLVSTDSRHEGTLFRLKDSGALQMGSRIAGVGRSGVLQEWTLTPAGRVLKQALAKLRN